MKKLVPVLFLICCLSLPVLADGIPPDGIISTRPGSGSELFDGTGSFTIFADGSCTPSGIDGVVSCGIMSFDPSTNTFSSNFSVTFLNVSGQVIGAGGLGLLYSFETFTATGAPAGVSQGGLRLPDNSDGTQFFELFNPLGADAAFLTSNVNSVLSGSPIGIFAAVVVVDPCRPFGSAVNKCEWTTDFAEVLVPEGGSTRITITATPEPATAVLLLTGLGAGYFRRRKARIA